MAADEDRAPEAVKQMTLDLFVAAVAMDTNVSTTTRVMAKAYLKAVGREHEQIPNPMEDLRDRLKEAAKRLNQTAAASDRLDERRRLLAKREGVNLALSYVEEYLPG